MVTWNARKLVMTCPTMTGKTAGQAEMAELTVIALKRVASLLLKATEEVVDVVRTTMYVVMTTTTTFLEACAKGSWGYRAWCFAGVWGIWMAKTAAIARWKNCGTEFAGNSCQDLNPTVFGLPYQSCQRVIASDYQKTV